VTSKTHVMPSSRARTLAGLLVALVLTGTLVIWTGRSALALETVDEVVTIAEDAAPADDEAPVGESVGEPAEDAPVDGEPAAGEAPDPPPDEGPADDLDGQPKDAGKD